MTQVSTTIHVVVAFVVIGILTWVIRRWSRAFSFGVVGLVLLIVPATLRFIENRGDWFYPVCTLVGVLILVFDLSGRRQRGK